MKKVLATLVALAMVLGLALTVQAEPPTFSISIDEVTGGPGSDPSNNTYTNPISLSGNASATYFPGQLDQYQVQINWGDGVLDIDSNFVPTESGANFTATWSSDPNHTYTIVGNYTITVKLYHGQPPGNEASGDVGEVVTITVANTPPVAVNDTYSVDEDNALNIAAPGVLDNDSDVDGDPLTAVKVSDPSNGTLALNADGSFSYTPDGDFNGSDAFTYNAYDGASYSENATVAITVNPVNDDPVAGNDTYSVDEDNDLNVAAPGVLGNDSDVEGDPLTAVKVSDPSNGTLALNADGSFTYTPDGDFNGSDAFTYKANDTYTDSNVATVAITVNPVNDDPVAGNDTYSVDEDNALNLAAPGVLGNDSDVEGDPLTAVKVSDPSNGTLALNADGSFTYTPDGDFNGSDAFTYKANDTYTDSNVATVAITVNPINDDPVAGNDTYSVDEDNTLNVAAPGVLGNDSDVDGDPLTAIKVSDPSNGTLALNADGSFTYTPVGDFNGSDAFTYKANDTYTDSNVATVAITINEVSNGGGGGGTGITRRYLTVDFLGEITRGPITYDGRLLDDLNAPSPDGMHLLELAKDTRTLDSDGEVVTLIEIIEVDAPTPLASSVLVGNAYDFGPSNITFSQPVMLTLGYNVGELPDDTLAVVMAYYSDEDTCTELETESSQVAEIGHLTGTTDHFTIFALFAAVPSFELGDLSIVPSHQEIWAFPTFVVKTGEEALITIKVANTGNREATYTATLQIDGEIRDTSQVTLVPGQSKLVVFTISDNEPGQYQVVVDGLSGEWTTSLWINWWLIGIIIAALLLIIFFTVWSYRRRGKPVEAE